jgi:beta-1,4-mannosyltransferase
MQDEQIKMRAYLYPRTSRTKTSVPNPYVGNFIGSTSNFINYLNENTPSNIGIFNLYRFIFKIDLLVLNWIEELPDKKGGTFQSVFFLILLKLIGLSRIKIVWTLHNKFSHSSQNIFLKRMLFFNLLKQSDLIVTHSTEGINFAESLCPGVSSRIFYFPHPIVPAKTFARSINEKKYDILIWGTLAPYKAIDSFLEFLSDENALMNYRILIAGKAVYPEFLKELKKYENENIIIRDQYIESDELAVLFQQSRIVLFTYSGDSVLSSGALMDSISHGAIVFGPDVGAFSELGNAGIIKTYGKFEDLKVHLEQLDQLDNSGILEKIHDFVNSHTWPEFSKVFEKRLKAV